MLTSYHTDTKFLGQGHQLQPVAESFSGTDVLLLSYVRQKRVEFCGGPRRHQVDAQSLA